MSKFLYFQDFHISGRNSRNYLGNYFQDCLDELDEILQIAKDKKCDAIIDGGDFFETSKPAYNIIDMIADKVEASKVKIYSLFGNHCMNYSSIERSNDTGLAHLQKRSKYFNDMELFDLNAEEMRAEGYEIKTFDYHINIEEELKENGIFFEDGSQYKIAIIHALVTPEKFFDSVSHVQCKDIKTNANLVLLAHYHKPFKKEINGTTFLNIGCVGRMNIDEASIEPSVLLIDTDKKDYEIITLKSAKSDSKIFDLSKYEELKGQKKDIRDFLESLKDVNLQSMDIKQQIAKIGKEQSVDESIINYIFDKMENVE